VIKNIYAFGRNAPSRTSVSFFGTHIETNTQMPVMTIFVLDVIIDYWERMIFHLYIYIYIYIYIYVFVCVLQRKMPIGS